LYYCSLDLRLGMSAQRPVSRKRAQFHHTVISLCYPQYATADRRGEQFTTAMDFASILYQPDSVKPLIERSVRECGRPSAVLLDYSANPPERIREQVLLNSIAAIALLTGDAVCRDFIVLLPKVIDPTRRHGIHF